MKPYHACTRRGSISDYVHLLCFPPKQKIIHTITYHLHASVFRTTIVHHTTFAKSPLLPTVKCFINLPITTVSNLTTAFFLHSLPITYVRRHQRHYARGITPIIHRLHKVAIMAVNQSRNAVRLSIVFMSLITWPQHCCSRRRTFIDSIVKDWSAGQGLSLQKMNGRFCTERPVVALYDACLRNVASASVRILRTTMVHGAIGQDT